MNIAGDILNKLFETHEEGEWQSITLNITAGPEEAPVIYAAILPGTTETNAKRIQDQFLVQGQEVNDPA